MEITGRIIEILNVQSGVSKATGKEWKSQDYVIETQDQYPRKICFNLFGDNIDKFNIQMGEDLTVSIDIESREYNGRWYTNIRGWKVERGTASAIPSPQDFSAPASSVDPLSGAPTTSTKAEPTDPASDLPF